MQPLQRKFPQVDPVYEKEAGLMELHVLQHITHPRSRQHMNNAKNYATTRFNMQINYSLTWREIASINVRKKHSSGFLIIFHKNGLSSLFLTDSTSI